MRGNVQFDKLFVQRVPVAVSERRCLDPAGFAGVGIEETTQEPLFLNAAFQVRNTILRTDARALWKAAHAAKYFGEQFYLTCNEIVRFFRVPLDELRNFAVHHL